MRRYQNLIAGSVVATARRFGRRDPAELEDLIQEVYVRLCARNGHALRSFEPHTANAEFGYLKVIAANVVRDWIGRRRSAGQDETRAVALDPGEEPADKQSWVNLDREVLLGQVDRALRAEATERDRHIFWLYYRTGLTAEHIANFRCFHLGPKGVESAIFKTLRIIRSRMTAGAKKGKAPGKTFT
jgi:RNA polymerase sigma-70 factor (ECF subfamily)